MRYQWRRNGIDLSDDNRIAGSSSRILQITQVQAIPWFGLALMVFVVVTLTIAWRAPEDWLTDAQSGKPLLASEAVRPVQGLLVACCSVIYFPAGLLLRRHHLVLARFADNMLLCLAPVCLLGGLAVMADQWPVTWPTLGLAGQRVTPPDLAQLALSVACLALAARVQLRFYALAGLTFLTIAEWRIGWLFMNSGTVIWPVTLLLCGLALVGAIAFPEIRRRHRRAREDMDDVAEHLDPRAWQNNRSAPSESKAGD